MLWSRGTVRKREWERKRRGGRGGRGRVCRRDSWLLKERKALQDVNVKTVAVSTAPGEPRPGRLDPLATPSLIAHCVMLVCAVYMYVFHEELRRCAAPHRRPFYSQISSHLSIVTPFTSPPLDRPDTHRCVQLGNRV